MLSSVAVGNIKKVTLIGFFALITGAYFYAAVLRSSVNHLWMDEILAVSTARNSSLAGIWAEIWNGTDFSPPTYHILLHYFVKAIGVDNLLVWRIPSIVAVYGSAVCIYALVRKRLSSFVALLAFGIILNSGLFDYAVQARPYGLLTLGLASSLLLWDRFQDTRLPKTLSLMLWLILSTCISLHFYGFVEVATIGIAETVWLISRRQFRWGIWLPLIFTIPVQAAWYPLASHLAIFTAGDSMSAYYYGKPTLRRLCYAMYEVILGGKTGVLLLLAVSVLLAGADMLENSPLRKILNEDLSRREGRKFALSELEIIILALFLLPLVAFWLSFFVTRSFNIRYTITAALFSGIAFAHVLDKLPSRRAVALALIPIIFVTLINRSEGPNLVADVLTTLKTLNPPLPVVIGEGLLYIELMEAADAKTRPTLFYLKKPPDSVSPDPTDENEVKRLKTFHPEYQVSEQQDFLSANPRFYVITRDYTVDTTTPSLKQKGLIKNPLTEVNGIVVFRAESTVNN
jgi:hypothetical protein